MTASPPTGLRAANRDLDAVARATKWSHSGVLRTLVVGAGLCWAVAFVAIALVYKLQLYADGAMFSYAVAVQDVWAFHWHNISGRLTVYLLNLLPAELCVGLTGNPDAGILVYGLLFYLAPLASLVATFAADRSHGRIIFVYACCSTIVLCPLVFGFPTEMWMAHAMFWPALAVSHYAKRSLAGTTLVFMMLLALAFTHEGGLVLATAIVATLALRGLRDAVFIRSAAILVSILVISAAVKLMLPPDEYYSSALLRAALHFFDLTIFKVRIVQLLLGAIAAYGLIFLALSRLAARNAYLYAAVIVIATLGIYWLAFDDALLSASRYYLRTAVFVLTPAFGLLAAYTALSGDERLAFSLPVLERALALSNQAARPLAAALVIVMLVHVVETAKFIKEWRNYVAAVAALAASDESDRSLGDERFISSARIAPELNRLSWFSTTPYLSVLVSNFRPNRIVVDPAGNYFWLSCATATGNAEATRTVPKQGRDLIRIYSCLHRP
jgi:hypothetical protein